MRSRNAPLGLALALLAHAGSAPAQIGEGLRCHQVLDSRATSKSEQEAVERLAMQTTVQGYLEGYRDGWLNGGMLLRLDQAQIARVYEVGFDDVASTCASAIDPTAQRLDAVVAALLKQATRATEEPAGSETTP